MKGEKIICLLILFFAAMPAASFAGSATSRWDLTIGGFVKFDMGWGSQSQGQDAPGALASGNGPYESAADKYGNFYSYAGETRLNFLTKGPDAWGAKTSAFIEGHFRGDASTPAAQGTFALRHAFMAFDWPRSKLIIGHTFQKWGLLPTFANFVAEYAVPGPFLKGQRQPQIRFEQSIAKNWNWALAVISPTNTLGNNPNNTSTGVVDSYTRSQMPFWEGSIGWTSDKCGNIGLWQMLFALEGFYGRQKQPVTQITGTAASPTSISYTDKDVNAWGISFKGFVPVIPERKGNKSGTLSVSGVLFYTQNPSWYQGSYAIGSYARPSDTSTSPAIQATAPVPDFAAPVQYGGWGQISYYLTDRLSVNGWYGYLRNLLSQAYCNVNVNAVQNTSQTILNLAYDVNQAVRFALEGAHFTTRYGGSPVIINGIPTTQKDGSYYTVRVGAWYFF